MEVWLPLPSGPPLCTGTFEYSRAGEMFMAMVILDVDIVDLVCKPV